MNVVCITLVLARVVCIISNVYNLVCISNKPISTINSNIILIMVYTFLVKCL